MRALLGLLVLAPQVLFRVADGRIDEASGIARGIRSPGVVYVQNDSGDSARFFALDLRSGRTAATITVRGATNVDWEDLAVAPDATGTPSVWLGDIGDNRADRPQIQLYRVDEPAVAGTDRDRAIRSTRPDVWHLRYPDGAHNAEGLAVTPAGRAYVVTKSVLGVSGVYAVPARPSAQTQTLTRVGKISFTATAAGLGGVAQLLATGAAVSADGALLVVRTYTDAYLWSLRGRTVAAALATAPRRIPLPDQRQGEGIAVDGTRLLIDSEGKHEPVYAVPIAPAPASTTPTSTPSASATARASGPASPAGGALRTRGGGSGPWLVAGIGAGGAIVLAAVVALYRRRYAAR